MKRLHDEIILTRQSAYKHSYETVMYADYKRAEY